MFYLARTAHVMALIAGQFQHGASHVMKLYLQFNIMSITAALKVNMHTT